MKRFAQTILFMIVLALLARTAVDSFNPGFGRLGTTSCSTTSDWTEEAAGEDDSNEEDKAVNELPSLAEHIHKSTSPKSLYVFALLEHIQEIVVPPPQS